MEAPVLLGCQGWNHPTWADSGRIDEPTHREVLRNYATEFATVEVADTFAGIPPAALLESWGSAVPEGFRFALKVPQQITHERRFEDAGGLLGRFLERVEVLGDNLGPLLMAMPVGFRPTQNAVQIVKRFVDSLVPGFKWALECRHSDWLTQELQELLRRRNVSLVLSDDRWVRRKVILGLASEPTADFSYVRWNTSSVRGTNGRPESIGPKRTLERWSPLISELRSRVSTVFGYVSHRFGGDQFPSCVRALRDKIERESTSLQVQLPLPP
ncbi:MAG: DUF72 domain-containing protein [Gemmatimonadota bacterium]|nr:MAG: DUF72 domain-containing protein [Gemmatimonadota bacterium]